MTTDYPLASSNRRLTTARNHGRARTHRRGHRVGRMPRPFLRLEEPIRPGAR